VGNLGGFVGPMIMGFLASRMHSFSAALLYLVASLFMAGILILGVGASSRSAAR
jgi:cyanate permease